MPHARPSQPTRHLPLEGTYNVRDIGGYPTQDGRTTRWRMFFRADSLHRLPPAAQQTLFEHGVRTVIDLRRASEIQEAPNILADSHRVTYHHLPLLGEARLGGEGKIPPPMLDVYRSILDHSQPQLCTALRTLAAHEGLPTIVHCTAGKDRTGLIAALVLGLVGVPAPTIAADYTLSAQYLVGPYLEESRRRAEARGYDWDAYRQHSICPPEFMLTTLQYLETRYGGVEAYIRAIGLEDTEIARLRQALVE